MRKLRLKAQSLGATEVLSREQLKNVLGGDLPTGKCYQCCDPNHPQVCGQCDTTGTGECEGHGKAVPCFCY